MGQFRLARAAEIDSLKGKYHVQADKSRSTSKFLLQKKRRNVEAQPKNSMW